MIRYASSSKTKWFVYLLECSDGSLYCGSTNDLIKRVKDHNDGNGAKYTRARLPVELVYSEKHKSRSSTLKREMEIKSWPRKRKLRLVIPDRVSMGPARSDTRAKMLK